MTTPKAILIGLSLIALAIAIRIPPATSSSLELTYIQSAIKDVARAIDGIKACRG